MHVEDSGDNVTIYVNLCPYGSPPLRWNTVDAEVELPSDRGPNGQCNIFTALFELDLSSRVRAGHRLYILFVVKDGDNTDSWDSYLVNGRGSKEHFEGFVRIAYGPPHPETGSGDRKTVVADRFTAGPVCPIER